MRKRHLGFFFIIFTLTSLRFGLRICTKHITDHIKSYINFTLSPSSLYFQRVSNGKRNDDAMIKWSELSSVLNTKTWNIQSIIIQFMIYQFCRNVNNYINIIIASSSSHRHHPFLKKFQIENNTRCVFNHHLNVFVNPAECEQTSLNGEH